MVQTSANAENCQQYFHVQSVCCVSGFVPTLDTLDVICRISYNYCSSFLLSKLRALRQRNLGISCQRATSSCQDWQLDDVITFLSETSESLLKIITVVLMLSLTLSEQLSTLMKPTVDNSSVSNYCKIYKVFSSAWNCVFYVL